VRGLMKPCGYRLPASSTRCLRSAARQSCHLRSCRLSDQCSNRSQR
jgi:hypothetical protein